MYFDDLFDIKGIIELSFQYSAYWFGAWSFLSTESDFASIFVFVLVFMMPGCPSVTYKPTVHLISLDTVQSQQLHRENSFFYNCYSLFHNLETQLYAVFGLVRNCCSTFFFRFIFLKCFFSHSRILKVFLACEIMIVFNSFCQCR